MLGIHLLFGSFLAGLTIPRNPRLGADLRAKFETATLTLLLPLPLFFAYTGLRTGLQLLRGGEMWVACSVTIALAVIGKAGGSALAARAAGMSWRESAMIGALLNTRGLMELVVLNIGLDLGVIAPRMFSIMILMSIVTTLMTAPLLRWIAPEATAPEAARDLGGMEAVV